MENVATSSTAGAVFGLSEFKGAVTLFEDEEPLIGPASGAHCVQYHYTIHERRRSGKKTTWVKIHDETRACSFWCKDREGEMLVKPHGARIISSSRTSYYDCGYRHTETALELNDPLYAIGHCAVEPTTGLCLQLEKPEEKYPFILSSEPESAVMKKLGAVGIYLLNGAFSFALLLFLTLFAMNGSFSATDYLAAAMVTPCFMLLVGVLIHYNDIIFLRERADRNWSNIDVSLKKRHDLIPALEGVVKAYMAHEAETFEAVAEMRSSYTDGAKDPESVSKYFEAERAFSDKYLLLCEAYPELKANQQAAKLMKTLVQLENEAAQMRKAFNDSVEAYNNRIETLPDVILAKTCHFTRRDFIQYQGDLIQIPASLKELWEPSAGEQGADVERQIDPTPADAAAAASEGPESPEAIEARASIYALLLSTEPEVKQAQLAYVETTDCPEVRAKAEELATAVAEVGQMERLGVTDRLMPYLKEMHAARYPKFLNVVRQLIEQDEEITLYEYTLQILITRHLDAVFKHAEGPETTYREIGPVVSHVSAALSVLLRQRPDEESTVQTAFNAGVAMLGDAASAGAKLLGAQDATLYAFDVAVDQLSRGSMEVRQIVMSAFQAAFNSIPEPGEEHKLIMVCIGEGLRIEASRPMQ